MKPNIPVCWFRIINNRMVKSPSTLVHSIRYHNSVGAAVKESANADNVEREDKDAQSNHGHDDIRLKILECSLQHVNRLGWHDDAITQAIADLHLPPMSQGILERGPVDLLEYFLTQKRIQVRKVMSSNQSQTSDTQSSSIPTSTDPLYKAISSHLDIIKPYIHTWPSAMALLADPRHIDITVTLAYDVVNDLCEFSGIESSRFDWYSERALLLMVYSSTELYMLTDKSENLDETKYEQLFRFPIPTEF